MNIPAFIENAGFFKGLSPEAVRQLAAVCRPLSVPRRKVLFREGDEGERFFLLVSGRVRLYRTRPDGRTNVIKIVSKGDVFAEVILFENERYPVTAEVIEESLLLAVSRREVMRLLEKEDFRTAFISMLMKKQRYLAGRVSALSSESVEERFFSYIREEYGDAGEIMIEIPKKEIAAAIGTVPETFSRMIKSLTERGLIDWKGRRLRITEGKGERER